MLRPFVPSIDHERSRQFYEALGFETRYVDASVAVMVSGNDSFILQNFYVKELAENLMVQLTVPDATAWWSIHHPERVADRFRTKPPTPPAMQAWGMMVGFIHDPSGVLWHVTETKKSD
jgi:predicted lactoylglutathione lyase